MNNITRSQKLGAEALGTGLLVATVVGSGIMAETLSKDVGLQLLCNTIPTGAILFVLITILGHFPARISIQWFQHSLASVASSAGRRLVSIYWRKLQAAWWAQCWRMLCLHCPF